MSPIRRCAQLQSLLGDYGNFNISTIDSFFQTVLRTFAREANLTGNYDVDLDDENAIIVGVDSMLSSINRATAEEMSGNRRIRLLEVWLKQFAALSFAGQESKLVHNAALHLLRGLVGKRYGEYRPMSFSVAGKTIDTVLVFITEKQFYIIVGKRIGLSRAGRSLVYLQHKQDGAK